MDTTITKLTVLFEGPFWIGLFERNSGGCYEVCKVTFGTEPKGYDVYHFLNRHFDELHFSPPIRTSEVSKRHINPKRMQRIANRQIHSSGMGTKAQQALKLQQEQGKLVRKTRSKEEREAEKERRFQLRLAKRKEKHRGH